MLLKFQERDCDKLFGIGVLMQSQALSRCKVANKEGNAGVTVLPTVHRILPSRIGLFSARQVNPIKQFNAEEFGSIRGTVLRYSDVSAIGYLPLYAIE
jgi:hypothetical protein